MQQIVTATRSVTNADQHLRRRRFRYGRNVGPTATSCFVLPAVHGICLEKRIKSGIKSVKDIKFAV